MKYKYLKHTSEAKFRAFGVNIDDVFKNSAIAMMNILGDTTKVKNKKNKKINIKSKNLTALLYDFLSELLFFLDTENFFLHDIKEIKVDKKNFVLSAIIEGDLCKNYDLTGDIKAVTYNDMSIKKTVRGYEVVVVVDV